MAIAGKVAITLSTENGGAWSADVTYDRLVAVKHNNNLYISRKTVANVEPPNDEFWFLALEGFGGDDVEDIINGTTQVGNAKTLDGHGAEYFLLSDGSKPVSGNLFCINNGKGVFYDDGSVMAIGGDDDTANSRSLVVNHPSYTADVKKAFKFRNKTNNNTVDYIALHEGNFSDYALPLTSAMAQEIKVNSSVSMATRNTSGTANYFHYYGANSDLGYLGFSEANKPTFLTTGGVAQTLLHTGNKPTGTYTGNGSTVKRTIATGGTGRFILIFGNNGTCAIASKGAIGREGTTVKSLTASEVDTDNSNLYIISSDACINANGVVYTYYVA